MARKSKIFASVLERSRSIADIYYNDSALRDTLSDDPAAFADLLAVMRAQMTAGGGIKQLPIARTPVIDDVERMYRAGRVAAVDGTDAISRTESTSKTVYAAGVISVTAQTLHDPRISMTESHREIPILDSDKDFGEFLYDLDAWVDENQSWVRTFREYCEREEVLRLIDEHDMALVMVDGPLYTQNLITQEIVWPGIIDGMQKRADRLIGFIKDMQSSKIMQLAGMALRPGEYWTVREWRKVLRKRFQGDREKLRKIDSARSDWVRTVYRKNAKAFAFECHPDLVEVGVSLIASPMICADVINHEIPFLLHSADRIICARVNARAKSDNLINTSPYFANLANERTFR